MSANDFPIKPDTPLHRLPTMVAEEVAKSLSDDLPTIDESNITPPSQGCMFGNSIDVDQGPALKLSGQ